MKGLSNKEIEIVSWLELNDRFFFTRSDIKKFFKNENNMNFYLYRLSKKKRIIKLNQFKYYLIPVKAFRGHWSEHPFIIIDELFNGKSYRIVGSAAAHYWGLIEQIPTKIEVQCMNKQGVKDVFNFSMIFRRIRPENLKKAVKGKIKGHSFLIAPKHEVIEWVKSN